MRVTTFKKGPDYIDAGWLAMASGRPCYNLDPFLIGEERVLPSFVEHSSGSDFALIEGNRGVFDGMDAEGSLSTARMARILRSPVLLIMDCSKMTRTAAALLQGVERFEPGLKLGGVVLNQIAGGRHESVIRESIRRYCKAPVLGAIPRLSKANFPERHMGLTPYHEHPEVEEAISKAAETVERYVDMEGVLMAAGRAGPLRGRRPLEQDISKGQRPFPKTRGAVTQGRGTLAQGKGAVPPLTVGIMRDSAFQFYYPENFEELQKRGARLLDVSALRDQALPEVDALYIGGGFPETHAIALSGNAGFRRSLLQAIKRGLPVYAECGGLMYLGKSLILEGREYPMAGVFPLSFKLYERPQAHGYTEVKVTRANPFFKRGTVLRGHEFHYSRGQGPLLNNSHRPSRGHGPLLNNSQGPLLKPGPVTLVFKMNRGQGIADGRDGLCYKNVLATYTHLHALGAPEWAEGMLRAARAFKRGRGPVSANKGSKGQSLRSH
jgi:cobyrinic acid a,c-diamide synthase